MDFFNTNDNHAGLHFQLFIYNHEKFNVFVELPSVSFTLGPDQQERLIFNERMVMPILVNGQKYVITRYTNTISIRDDTILQFTMK
jgi:hypothetical protein